MSDWVQTTLGDLITLQRGFDITKAAQNDGSYPVVSSGGIASFHDQFMAKGPGVVVGRKGTLGTAFFIPENYWPHDTTLWVKNFKGNDEKFIYYLLKSIPLERLDSGSANPTLNRNYAHLLRVAAPKPAIQEKIASVLSALDAKIDLNQRINAELEALAKTIYDYWFVQFDFPDAHGRPYKSSGGAMVWNDTLKREIPAGWRVGRLDDAMRLEYGKPLKDSDRTGAGYPVLGSNGVVGHHSEYLIEGPGIVVGRKGTVGAVTFVHENFSPIDTTYYVKPKQGFGIFFLHQLLRTLPLARLNSDSAVPGLNRESAHRLPVVLPSEDCAAQFESITAQLMRRTRSGDDESRELIQLRDWLLPLLMNGQVRVA